MTRRIAIFLLLGLGVRAFAQSPFPVEILEPEGALGSNTEAWLSGRHIALDAGRAVALSGTSWVQPRLELFRREADGWRPEGELTVPGLAYEYGLQVRLQDGRLALGAPEANRVYVFEERASAPSALNAWNTSDTTTTSGALTYQRVLTPAQHALAASEGWKIALRTRMVDDFGGTRACFLDFTDANNRRWLLFFDLDADGDLTVALGGQETLTLTDDGQGWADYHLHEIVMDPATGTADYYFDGQHLNSSPWLSTPITGLNGVRWGNASTAGKGSMNFNQVEMRTRVTDRVLALYDAGTNRLVPSPVAQGWTEQQSGANQPGRPVVGDLSSRWELRSRLAGDTDVVETGFGAGLGLDGDTLVVGSPYDSAFASSGGAVHVFVRENGVWIQQQKLVPPVVQVDGRFGGTVDFQGEGLVATAHPPGQGGPAAAAYVFTREHGSWGMQTELMGLPGVGHRSRITAVAIHGGLVALGMRALAGSNTGGAAVFERREGQWGLVAELTDDSSFTGFGSSIGTDGALLVVGHDDDSSAHVYAKDQAGAWSKATRLELSDWGHLTEVAVSAGRFALAVTALTDAPGDALVYQVNYGNAEALGRYARRVLYYPEAAASASFDPEDAAFRYKHLLYVEDAAGLRPDFDQLPALFADPERQLVETVRGELIRGLALQPEDPILGNLLLDIQYDSALVRAIASKASLHRALRIRFGMPFAPDPPPNGFAIDQELEPYRQVLAENRAALAEYFELFTDRLGSAEDPPLGYQLFRRWVPGRALEAAEYLDAAGNPQRVVEEDILFAGYKDLVFLFDLLRDHGRAAAELSRLLMARDRPGNSQGPDDREAAARVLGDAQRFLLTHGAMLKRLFPGLDPEPGEASGLQEAMEGWSASLTGLSTLEQLLVGGSNLLGFTDDFLMLVENFGAESDGIFDSFDSFMARLDPGENSSDLYYAVQTLADARGAYDRYRGYQDQLSEELSETSSITYRDRLRDIVGVFPGHPNYLEDPRANPGSELDQQYRSIERARLVVLRNKTEISNLRAQVQIEIERATDIANVYIDFGNRRARIAEKLADLNAAQAGANQLTDYLNPVNLASGASIAIALNFGVQTIAELEKGKLEAERERLAGLEQATIVGIESRATVKTLLLNMNTLAVESMDAALLLAQEVNRLAGLYREKADLEQALAERREELSTRYFADPAHRLLAENHMVRANLAFEEARRWLFFTVRALEYKWNTPFDHVYPAGGRRWTAATIFKARNADELELFYQAMANFNALINRARTPEFDGFSVREDFFGYRMTNSIGMILEYPDPVTGEPVTAVEAFRSRLRQLADAQGDIRIEFNTVRQVPGGSFFVGPRFANGSVIEKGRFLDKIDYLQIRLPGQHTLGLSSLRGRLTYGGASFIRNFNVGTPDPERPDRLRNEYTSYSTRYWFFDPTPGVSRWRFTDALTIDSVRMELAPDDRRPPAVDRILSFKERSVAATGWVLEIPTRSQGVEVMRIDELNDVEIYFSHFSAQRQ